MVIDSDPGIDAEDVEDETVADAELIAAFNDEVNPLFDSDNKNVDVDKVDEDNVDGSFAVAAATSFKALVSTLTLLTLFRLSSNTFLPMRSLFSSLGREPNPERDDNFLK